MKDPNHSATDLSTKLFYGIGAIANGAKANGFNYLLLFFYSQVIGLPPQWVSVGIFVTLIFDAVSDPLVGHFSDNLRSRWGRRHPFMYFAGLPVALAYFFLWSPPDLEPEMLLVYFIVLAIFVRTLITFYEVPSIALVAEFTDDYDQRTKFMSFRYFFAWWGGLTMAVLAYLVFLPEDKGGLQYVAGWGNYGLAASIIIFLSIYISAIGTHRHIPYLKQAPSSGPFNIQQTAREMKETLSNRSFLVLFVSALFLFVANGIATSLSIYFVRHFWEFTSAQIGVMQLPYFVSALLALFIAPWISKFMGKKNAAIAVTSASIFISPLPLILRMLDWFPDNGTDTLYYTLITIFTIEVALFIAATSLVAAMIADLVEDSEVSTGRRSEGLFFAANTFAQKAVSGVGVIVAGQILAYVNFPTQAALGEVPEEILHHFALVYIPALWGFYAVGLLILSQYRITRTSHSDNLAKLATSRTNA